MQTQHNPRKGTLSQRVTPETLQAIRVMAQTPVYFPGGKIVFEENGGIELYKGDDLIDEYSSAKDDAAVVALNLWRELNTMPETMLLFTLQKMESSHAKTGNRLLKVLLEGGECEMV